MSLPVFWMDGDELRAGDRVELSGPEGHHAAVVRRIKVGEIIELTDGAGHMARCSVTEVGKSGLSCEVTRRNDVPRPEQRITVVQALPKGDRGELAVELMTEVGVDVIVPWSAARCITRWKGERGEKSLRRWRSIAFEAAKQSRRAWFPEVAAPVTTPGAVPWMGGSASALVLHESAEQPIGDVAVPESGDTVLVVGPEGGVTDDELDTFVAAGASLVRLGPTVLRTSTAGVVATAALLARTRRWMSFGGATRRP